MYFTYCHKRVQNISSPTQTLPSPYFSILFDTIYPELFVLYNICLLYRMETPIYYLFRSDKPTKKYTMLMRSEKHLHYFGQNGYRDYTLMNDKKSKFYEPDFKTRERVKYAYHKRHSKEKGGRHTPSSMSKIILWNKPSLKESIKDYEKKFKVKVIFKDKKLTESEKKKLMGI